MIGRSSCFRTSRRGGTPTERSEPSRNGPARRPREVVRCDNAGVTCRRWNWRQARRTQLRDDTTATLFILDVLGPVPDGAVHAADDDLLTHVTRLGPDVRTACALSRARVSRMVE